KALAIGDDADVPAILVTVDNCGVSAAITEEIAKRMRNRTGLARERLVVCSSHTHTAPCLTGVAPNLFSQDIPTNHQASIDRYTRELTDSIERVCLQALADRKPAQIAWGKGRVEFAKNRRTAGGPVDPTLPLIEVKDENGMLRAVLVNYACHCTTLEGDHNK